MGPEKVSMAAKTATIKVFLSSVWLDLQPERNAAEKILHGFSEVKFIGMEYFGSRNETAQESSLRELDECQLFVGIFDERYGSGITEDEYRRARATGVRCLIYWKDRQELKAARAIDDEPLRKLHTELTEKHVIYYFSSPDDLAQRLALDIHKFLRESYEEELSASPFAYTRRVSGFLEEYLGTEDRLVPFGGRDAYLAKLNDWIDDPAQTPYLLIAGPAGRGKSALLARWSGALVHHAPDVQVVFFPINIRFRTNLANVVFAALTLRLAALHGKTVQTVPEPSVELWREMMLDYLETPLPEGRRLLVIVDGLDEAAGWEAEASLFPYSLPSTTRVVVSARYLTGDIGADAWLVRLGWDEPAIASVLLLEPLDRTGVADVLGRMSFPVEEFAASVDIVGELHRLSEGDPLLVRLYVDDLRAIGAENSPSLRAEELSSIPSGLSGYFERWMADQRRLWGTDAPLREPAVQSLLDVFSCALGPVLEPDLYNILPDDLRLSVWGLHEALRPLNRFIIGDGAVQGYVFSHPRLADHFRAILDKAGQAQVVETRFVEWGRETLENVVKNKLPIEQVSPYVVQHYRLHLERTGSCVELSLALLSEKWLNAWGVLEKGSFNGFLHDVEGVQRMVAKVNTAAIEAGSKAPYFDGEFRCALFRSSILSLGRRIPTILIVELVTRGVWTPAQVLVHASLIQSPGPRAMLLLEVGLQCDKTSAQPILTGALRAALLLKDDAEREIFVLSAADHYPQVGELARLAQSIREDIKRVTAICCLAPRLPEKLRKELLDSEFQSAVASIDDGKRGTILLLLAPLVLEDKATELLEIALALPPAPAPAQVRLLIALVDPASANLDRLVDTILLTAPMINDGLGRALLFEELLLRLGKMQSNGNGPRRQVVKALLKSALQVTDVVERVRLLDIVAAYLPDAIAGRLRGEARVAAAGIAEVDGWISSIVAILGQLDEATKRIVGLEALRSVRRLKSQSDRQRVLMQLLPHLPLNCMDEVLWEVKMLRADPGYMRMLQALAPLLPAEFPEIELQGRVAFWRSVNDDQALRHLPFLSASMQNNIIDEVILKRIVSMLPNLEHIDAGALLALAPHLTDELDDHYLLELLSRLSRTNFHERVGLVESLTSRPCRWKTEFVASLIRELEAATGTNELTVVEALILRFRLTRCLEGRERQQRQSAILEEIRRQYRDGPAEIDALCEYARSVKGWEQTRATSEARVVRALVALQEYAVFPGMDTIQEGLLELRNILRGPADGVSEWSTADALCSIALEIEDETCRVAVLAAIVPGLSTSCLKLVRFATRELLPGIEQARFISVLGMALGGSARDEAMRRALAMMTAIPEFQRRGLVDDLAPMLSTDLVVEAISALQTSSDKSTYLEGLLALASGLPDGESAVVHEALRVARTIKDDTRRAVALNAISGKLNGSEKHAVTSEALLAAACSFTMSLVENSELVPTEKAELLLLHAYRCSPEDPPRMLQAATAAAGALKGSQFDAPVFESLFYRLSEPQCHAVLIQAMYGTSECNDAAPALLRLFSKIDEPPKEALREALRVALVFGSDIRTRAMQDLAPLLARWFFEETMVISRELAAPTRVDLIVEMCEFLPDEQRQDVLIEVIGVVRGIEKDAARIGRLLDLTLALPMPRAELITVAVEAIVGIEDQGQCDDLLERVVPLLTDTQLTDALASIRAINDEDERAKTLGVIAMEIADPEARETIFESALGVAAGVDHLADRIEITAELASGVSSSRKRVLLEVAAVATRDIVDSGERESALRRLVASSEEADENMLADLLKAAGSMLGDQHWLLPTLMPLLPAPLMAFAMSHVKGPISPTIVHHLPERWLVKGLCALLAIDDEFERVEALLDLAPRLPAPLLGWALYVARNVRSPADRCEALKGLTPWLDRSVCGRVFAEALSAAAEIESEHLRYEVLHALVPCLPLSMLSAVLAEVEGFDNDVHRASLLGILSLCLTESQLDDVWPALQRIADPDLRAHVLRRLAPLAPSTMQDEALAVIRGIKQPLGRARALMNLSKRLTQRLRDLVLTEALTAASAIEVATTRVELLAELVPILPTSLVSEALSLAGQLRDEAHSALELGILAPHLNSEDFSCALNVAGEITDESRRVTAIVQLGPYLPEELFGQAVRMVGRIKRPAFRAEALQGLAPHLPCSALEEALAVVETLDAGFRRAETLCSLSRQLDDEELSDAFTAALNKLSVIEDVSYRADCMLRLASRLPVTLQQIALAETVALVAFMSERTLIRLTGQIDCANETILESLVTSLGLIKNTSTQVRLLELLVPQLPRSIVPKALTVACKISHRPERAVALRNFVPFLPEPWLGEGLQVVLAIEDEFARVDALLSIAPRLPAPLLEEALFAARNIRNPADRAEALKGFTPFLNDSECNWVFAEALSAAAEVERELLRCEVLHALVPCLPPSMSSAVLAVVEGIDSDVLRARLLGVVSLYLAESQPDEVWVALQRITDSNLRTYVVQRLAPLSPSTLLDEAVAVVRSIDLPWGRAKGLMNLSKRLAQPQCDAVLAEALMATAAIEATATRVEVLADLVRLLPVSLVSEALSIIGQIWDEGQRVEALGVLAPYLSRDDFPAALTLAGEIADESRRAMALVRLGPHLPEALFRRAICLISGIRRAVSRAESLQGLAAHVPGSALPEALVVVESFEAIFRRAETLCSLGPQMAEVQATATLSNTLNMLRDVEDISYRAELLSSLIPHVPEALMDELLGTIATIEDPFIRVAPLRQLLPRLSKSTFDAWLIATQNLSPCLRCVLLGEASEHTDAPAADQLLAESIDVAMGLGSARARIDALRETAHRQKSPSGRLVGRVLIATRETCGLPYYAQVVSELAAYLSEAQIDGVMAEVTNGCDVRTGPTSPNALAPYITTLCALAPYLTEQQAAVALAALSSVNGENARFQVLLAFAESARDEVLASLDEARRSLLGPTYSEHILSAIAARAADNPAPHSKRNNTENPTGQVAVISCPGFQQELNRFADALALQPICISEQPDFTFLKQLVAAGFSSNKIQNTSTRDVNLPSTAHKGIDQQFAFVKDYESGTDRASGIARLACDLPDSMLREAYEIIANIESEQFQIVGLRSLIPRLSASLLTDAWQRAYAMQDRNCRRELLALLAPYRAEIDAAKVYLEWQSMLSKKSTSRREDLLKAISARATDLVILGGEQLPEKIATALDDAGKWWR